MGSDWLDGFSFMDTLRRTAIFHGKPMDNWRKADILPSLLKAFKRRRPELYAQIVILPRACQEAGVQRNETFNLREL